MPPVDYPCVCAEFYLRPYFTGVVKFNCKIALPGFEGRLYNFGNSITYWTCFFLRICQIFCDIFHVFRIV